MRGHVPRIVGIDNPYSLENIVLWLFINKPEYELYKDNIYNGNNETLKIYHKTCGEDFYTSWHSIQNGQCCSVCSGKQVGKYNSLAYLQPDIASQLHSENEIKAEQITVSSKKLCYWICSVCGYGENKEWKTTVDNRTRKHGCPSCSGRVVSDRNRLSILYPEIASEWHPTKNGNLTPSDVSFGSQIKVCWFCPKGHEYFSTITGRTRENKGCKKCSSSHGEKKIENFLLSNDILAVSEKRFDDCKNKNTLPFDFGIPYDDGFWHMLEYYGEQHFFPVDFAGRGEKWAKEQFKKTKRSDKIKQKYCEDNNIPLLIIPYWDFDNIEQILAETFL